MRRAVLTAGLVTVACGGSKESTAKKKAPPLEAKVEDKVPAGSEAEPPAELKLPTTDTLRTTIEELSGDDFAGRRPGTEGGRKAVQYIETQMKALGLEPGGDGGTFRPGVTIRATSLDLAGATLELSGRGAPSPLTPQRDIVVTSNLAAGRHLGLEEVVFAGYGITAPEYEWDDFAGVDVTGKYVVVLVGDPPLTNGRFAGDAMTYYGRWSYKFARARELGALGCLVVHETEPASYGWDVVEASWSGERYGLAPDPDAPPPLLLHHARRHSGRDRQSAGPPHDPRRQSRQRRLLPIGSLRVRAPRRAGPVLPRKLGHGGRRRQGGQAGGRTAGRALPHRPRRVRPDLVARRQAARRGSHDPARAPGCRR